MQNIVYLQLFIKDEYYLEKRGLVKDQINIVACPKKRLEKFRDVVNLVAIHLFYL